MALAPLLTAKIGEQVERTCALVGLVPPGKFGWAPSLPSAAAGKAPMPLAEVLDHLQQSLAGLAATLVKLDAVRFASLRPLRAVGGEAVAASPDAWQQRFTVYWTAIEPAIASLSEADLDRPVVTVFRPAGEPVATLLLGNIEHFINHKYQLFFYLKLLGLDVSTADLYRLR